VNSGIWKRGLHQFVEEAFVPHLVKRLADVQENCNRTQVEVAVVDKFVYDPDKLLRRRVPPPEPKLLRSDEAVQVGGETGQKDPLEQLRDGGEEGDGPKVLG
jgi:hypothetical protein